MHPVNYFDQIPAQASKEMVFIRLGRKKNIAKIDEAQQRQLDEAIREGELLCRVKGAYMTVKVSEKNSEKIILENGMIFESGNLAEWMFDADELVLMAATAGKEVIERRDKEINSGNAMLGVVIDAVASETADEGLNRLEDIINKMLVKQGKILTKRYSPGYGDLALSAQKDIYNLLKLDKIGITITESMMLEPEKSVTAIAGVIPI